MTGKTISLFAVALWGVTFLFAGVYVWRDKTVVASDHRKEIPLSNHQRDLVLTEMRGVLNSLNGILLGLSEGNLGNVEQAARASGMKMAADDSAGLIAKLPKEFKQMGFGLHKDFDALADAVKAGENAAQLLDRTAKLTSRCNGCHSVYRLGLEKTAAPTNP